MAAATGGRVVGPDAEFEGASFDSREVVPGQLFVPLVAERDGHDFIEAALQAGAAGYLSSRRVSVDGSPCAHSTVPAQTVIEVADTTRALLDLAMWARGRFPDRVVGITGSVGKTSTKDLVAGAVAGGLVVTANPRSYNNDHGLPVTILDASEHTEVLVLEMGMRGFGEIRRLCTVGRPTIGVVTAVGEAHTARVGGLEGVAVAKRELVESLPRHGTAVLNADDPRVVAMATHTEAATITFGTATGADVRVSGIVLDELARSRFLVESPWGTAQVALAVSGAHMAMNAAAAVAVAGVLGVPLEASVDALITTTISEMRMQASRTSRGCLIINDAYNANPTSMLAALDSLASLQVTRRIAILGVMAELDDPVTAHLRIAESIARAGIELVAVGTDLYGVDPIDDPIALLGHLGPESAVLVKGSRVAGLEWIARELGMPGPG